MRLLFERQIVKYTIISILTGVVRTSVLFWLPTYFTERLGYAEETSTLIFTFASLAICCGSFIVIFIYERIGHDMDKTVLLMFSSAAICFAVFVMSPQLLSDEVDDGAVLVRIYGINQMSDCGDHTYRQHRNQKSIENLVAHIVLT